MEYNPENKYTWTPEDKFELSGQEFGIILNTIRAILSTEQAAQILLANKANNVLDNILSNSLKEGVIKEVTE